MWTPRWAITVFICTVSALAQNPPPDPAFEIASVRPAAFPDQYFEMGFYTGKASHSSCLIGKLSISGSLVRVQMASVCDLISFAYGVKGFQIVGAPTLPRANGMQESATLVSTHPSFFYDVEARASGQNEPSKDQLRAMFRSLLAERFALQVHHESREMNYYAAVVRKRDSKLTPAIPACKRIVPQRASDAIIHVCGASIENMIQQLSEGADRPVTDATGLQGTFDYDIRPGAPDETAGLFQEFLGIALESRKGPVDVVVVDHVEAASPN